MKHETDMIPDFKEREEALDPSRSFIVQAPAGSGKTELLIQRFLTLLPYIDKPEQILAITFTRKAAGEMHLRIMQSLERARDNIIPDKANEKRTHELAQKVLQKDEKMEWDILSNPARLKVQTIDSFCSSLTSQMPILSRLGSNQMISDTPNEPYVEAARRTAEMINENSKDGEAFRTILRHLDNSVLDLENRLVMMLESREQWLRHLNKEINETELRDMLECSVKRVIEETLERSREVFQQSIPDGFEGAAIYAATNLLNENSSSNVTRLHDFKSLPDAKTDDLPIWEGIADFLLTGTGTWRKPGGINKNIGFPSDGTERAKQEKEKFKEILESLSGKEELLKELQTIKDLPNSQYDEDEWTVLNALLHLLPIAVNHLMRVFSETSAVDFQAVAMAAVEALGTDDNPTDLMLSLDLKIQHILVDEYQDTSMSQVTLLRALTRGWEHGDGRTLFVVGDPMQSIYLFRGAEVGLFLDARINGINFLKLSPLILKSNFRSNRQIVEWVNNSFKTAFPEKEDIFTDSIPFVPSLPIKTDEEDMSVDVRLYEERNEVTEAEEIVSVIGSIDKGESVAILARSRVHLNEIVDQFKKKGVDFKSQDLDSLIDRPVIRDLFSLLRALMHPYDRIAWLASLRAPWCGLMLPDLHEICAGDRNSPVWTLINDESRVDSLSQDGQCRVSSFVEKFKNALNLRGRVSPGRLLEGLWLELGGPATVVDCDSMDDSSAFFEMLDSVSIAGEIESLKLLEYKIENLYANHSGKSENPVEIMTIHKAKGLEFDHVIIPGLGKRPRVPDKRLLFWMERGDRRDDLLLAPIEKKGSDKQSAIYKYLSKVYGDKELLEQTRLFYVAATRARKKLYLFGHVKASGDDGIKTESKSFLSSIEKSLNTDMIVRCSTAKTMPVKTEGGCADLGAVPRLKRLPAKWKRPDCAQPITVDIKTADKELDKLDVPFYWAGGAIKHLGTVIHKYLCRIAQEGLPSWNIARIEKQKNCIEAMLSQHGLNKEEVFQMSKKGVEILCQTLNDDSGLWILADHLEGLSEMPVTSVINGEIIHAIIDRTFVDDNDIRWIIDYKISFHGGGLLGDFLESEKKRYKEQLEKYASILESAGENRKIKKALYHPALSTLTEL